MSTLFRYTSPLGDAIIGTAEIIDATALIIGIDPETGNPVYDGGTKIHWTSQRTLERNGSNVHVCEAGRGWTVDQLSVTKPPPDFHNDAARP